MKPKKSVKPKFAKDAVCGDFRLMAKTATGFNAQCWLCGHQKRFTLKQLTGDPSPVCSAPQCVKPESKQKTPIKSPSYLSADERKKLDRTYSTFEAHAKEARRLLKSLKDSPDTALDRSALATYLDLIPYAERRYRQWSTQPNAYALNSMMDTMRDIVRELQSEEGKDALLRVLVVDAMHPCIKDIAQAMADGANAAWVSIDEHIDDNDKAKARKKLNRDIIACGKRVKEILETTREHIMENIVNPASPEPRMKPKRKRTSWK